MLERVLEQRQQQPVGGYDNRFQRRPRRRENPSLKCKCVGMQITVMELGTHVKNVLVLHR
jgi:hypothetical protein